MLHVRYAGTFQFDSHLGDFPFFTFFKTFQSLCLGVRFRVSVRVNSELGLALGLALGLRLALG